MDRPFRQTLRRWTPASPPRPTRSIGWTAVALRQSPDRPRSEPLVRACRERLAGYGFGRRRTRGDVNRHSRRRRVRRRGCRASRPRQLDEVDGNGAGRDERCGAVGVEPGRVWRSGRFGPGDQNRGGRERSGDRANRQALRCGGTQRVFSAGVASGKTPWVSLAPNQHSTFSNPHWATSPYLPASIPVPRCSAAARAAGRACR